MNRNKLRIIKDAAMDTFNDLCLNNTFIVSMIVLFLFLSATIPGFSLIMIGIVLFFVYDDYISSKKQSQPYDYDGIFISVFFLIFSSIMSVFSVYYFFSIPVSNMNIIIIKEINNSKNIPYVSISIFSVVISLIITCILKFIFYITNLFLTNLKKYNKGDAQNGTK